MKVSYVLWRLHYCWKVPVPVAPVVPHTRPEDVPANAEYYARYKGGALVEAYGIPSLEMDGELRSPGFFSKSPGHDIIGAGFSEDHLKYGARDERIIWSHLGSAFPGTWTVVGYASETPVPYLAVSWANDVQPLGAHPSIKEMARDRSLRYFEVWHTQSNTLLATVNP